MIRIILIVVSFISFHLLQARTIVVSDNMSSQAINNKVTDLQAGDTLLLKKGYYKINLELIDKHGLPDKPIVIKGENRTETVIDGSAITPSSTLRNFGIYMDHCSWITIDNLSFQNCWVDAVRADNSSYVSLINSNIDGSRRALFAQGRKSHHFLIENCFWEQGEHVWTKQGNYSWEELHHGDYRHYNGSIFQAKMIGGSFVIRDNYIRNVYNGIRLSIMGDAENDTLACTNGEVYRNVIENSADNAFEPEVYCKNLHFYHNKMINSHAFISVTEVGGGPLYFYGNTGVKLPDCKDGWTIFKTAGKERRLTEPFYIFNNSWQVDSDVLGSPNRSYWHNDNIYHFNNAYYITNADTVGIYHLGKNNRFENDCANIPFPDKVMRTGNIASIVGDPMFVDGKYGNFHLREGSACKDKGIVPDGIDIYFTGDKLDIGAYDDNILVEGPVFRYTDPGEEMPDKEKPRIVKHKIDQNKLTLWFSAPLDSETIQARNFWLNTIPFSSYILEDDGYRLVLQSEVVLPVENIALQITEKPKGTNGEEIVLWASSIPTHTITEAEKALSLTQKVANNLISNVLFDFEPKVVTFNANVSRLDISGESLRSPQHVAYGLITINTEIAKDVFLGFSFEGDIKLLLNGKEIFKGKSDKEYFEEYTYNRFRFENEKKVHLQKGANTLLVKATGGLSGLRFSCCVMKENNEFDNSIQVVNNIPNSYINNWLTTDAFVSDSINPMNIVFEPEQEIKEYYTINGDILSWKMQSPMIQQSLKLSPNTTNRKGFNADWNYANANTLLGILNLYYVSDDFKLRQFVEAYDKHIFDNYNFFEQQYVSDRIMRGAYFRLFRANMLDDTSGSILPLAEMATSTLVNQDRKDLLNKTLDYVLHQQSRLDDGTLCRPEPLDETVWADDMFMSVPFLLRMAKLNNDNSLYDEAAFQVLNINKHLTDKSTGLCRHGWYNSTQELSPVAWARANGWIVWAMSDALLRLPANHKDYEKIKEILIDRLDVLPTYQSQSGLWHQIIDNPDSYLETSASAMFALGLATAINNDWITDKYIPQLELAWQAISEQVDECGKVNGICPGTDMGRNAEYYLNQKPLASDPRGMGAVLTLGSEMYKYFKSKK